MNLENPRLPELREHDFRSSVPVIGPLISWMRRLLYSLTAKWGVWTVIQQQNRINQMIEERLCRMEDNIEDQLHDLRTLLVDLDRDLTLLARTVAEIEVRQRCLLRAIQSQSEMDSPARQEE